jgi:membrane protein
MKRFKRVFQLLGEAGVAFINDNGLKLSASLSYYTVFALGPLLIIIISLAGIFFGRDAVQGKMYEQLNGLIGGDAALQIQQIISNIQHSHVSTTGAIIGSIMLVVGATGVFAEIQDSINYIWSVKAKPKRGWKKFLFNRLLSFSLVIGLGFLLLVSLVANALLALLSDRVTRLLPGLDIDYIHVANNFIILAVITGLFAVIFKVLPDAIISWRDSLLGASFTAVLFLVGKFLIGLYVGKANLGLTYGTAASVIIILIWVYYSSIILYYGAEFTKIFAIHGGSGIRPKNTAVFIIKKESKEVPGSYLDT